LRRMRDPVHTRVTMVPKARTKKRRAASMLTP
jgi:hypothetical protein